MFKIEKKLVGEIIKACAAVYPEEACGLVAGSNEKATKIIKMANTSDDPVHCYLMEPKEQLQVMKQLRNDNLEMLAIYHSHAEAEAYPSGRDVELAYYPDAFYMIVSLKDKDNPDLRVYGIVDGKIKEESIKI